MKSIQFLVVLLGLGMPLAGQEPFNYYWGLAETVDISVVGFPQNQLDYRGQSSEGGHVVYYSQSDKLFSVFQYGEMGQVERRFYNIDSCYFIKESVFKYDMPFYFEDSKIVEVIDKYFLVYREAVLSELEGKWTQDPSASFLINMATEVEHNIALDIGGSK